MFITASTIEIQSPLEQINDRYVLAHDLRYC